MKWMNSFRRGLLLTALLLCMLSVSLFAAPPKAAKTAKDAPKKTPTAPAAPVAKGRPEVTPPPISGIPAPDDLVGRADARKARVAELLEGKLVVKLMGLFEDKKYDEAKTVAMQLIRLSPKNGTHWYNLACIYSRLDKAPSAFKCLRRAVDLGYDGIRHMERDEDLRSLRDTKEFSEIVSMRDEIHRKRAERIEADLRKKYGEDYLIEVDHENKLVFATNIDRQTLDALKSQLTQRAQMMWKVMFRNRFERYVTVIIPKTKSSEDMGDIGGYYNPSTSVLVARQLGMVMRHEFTHALHFADIEGREGKGMHPIWVAEGLATLCEGSTFDAKGKLVPGNSERLHHLRPYLKRYKSGVLLKIMKLSHGDFMRSPGFHYSASRFMMAYLHHNGKLREWYDTFRTAYPDEDKTGQKTWEKVFGKPIETIEVEWRTWLILQHAPKMTIGANGPFMGLGTDQEVDGLKITRVVSESSAAKAGLRVGDVLVGLAGQTIYDQMDMTAVLLAHEVGDTIAIRFRRGKKYNDGKLTLMARPASYSDPRVPPHPAADKPYVGLATDSVGNKLTITRVVPKSSAAKAGLKVGDVLVRFGGKAVSTTAEVKAALAKHKVGETIAVSYRRGKETINAKMKLLAHPDAPKRKLKPDKPTATPKPPAAKPAMRPVNPPTKPKPPAEVKAEPVLEHV